MPALSQLVGKTFSRLTVIERAGTNNHKKTLWLCICWCGGHAIVQGANLVSGSTRSCGCLLGSGNEIHGQSGLGKRSRAYTCWMNMRLRCQGVTPQYIKDYLNRGICVCSRWDSFKNFFADMGDPPAGMSLDRINNDGNYTPENCRWATRIEQRHNSRGVRMITIHGESIPLCVAVQRYSPVAYGIVVSRLHRGWSVTDAIFKPKSSKWSRRHTIA